MITPSVGRRKRGRNASHVACAKSKKNCLCRISAPQRIVEVLRANRQCSAYTTPKWIQRREIQISPAAGRTRSGCIRGASAIILAASIGSLVDYLQLLLAAASQSRPNKSAVQGRMSHVLTCAHTSEDLPDQVHSGPRVSRRFWEDAAFYILHAFSYLGNGNGMTGKRWDSQGFFCCLDRFLINMHCFEFGKGGVSSEREALLRLAYLVFYLLPNTLHLLGSALAEHGQGNNNGGGVIYNCELLLDGYTPSIIRPTWTYRVNLVF